MYGVGISLVLGWLVALVIPKRFDGSLHTVLACWMYAAFGLSATCAVLYLFYPNFIDHLEPTITQISLIWMQGGDLYPSTQAPSMHGLLYGPALYWIQLPFLLLGSDPILSSKLPSVLAFNLAWVALFFMYKNTLSKAYLLFLLPFNLILFWNRAEPYFVLLVGLAILIIDRRPKAWALLLGVLAGLASSFKAHGVLYILPFFVFFGAYSFKAVLEFALAFAVICLAFFLNDATSLTHYLAYLKLAAKHGISWAYLEKNLFFLFFIWLPIALTFKHAKPTKADTYRWAGVAIIELIVAIAGSKPGAGVHHLIPVIVLNSFLYEVQLRKIENVALKFREIKIAFAILAIYVLTSVWKNVYDSEIKSQALVTTQSEAQKEIQQLSASYPNLLMGVTDKENDNYRLTFLRPYLIKPSTPQFEYAGFMDLNYSGISDQVFTQSLQQCQYTHIAMPNHGAPFSIANFYTNEPLFSGATRSAFAQHYAPLIHGAYYTVYACKA